MKDIMSEAFSQWCNKNQKTFPEDENTLEYINLYQEFLDFMQSHGFGMSAPADDGKSTQNSRGRVPHRGGIRIVRMGMTEAAPT